MKKEKTEYYEDAIKVADGIYWIGFYDVDSGLHCNPYLIIDNDEAVVIDGGSRPDFPTVMMKILRTGVALPEIKALIYQHYDPDLCGSIPNFEALIGQPDLKIISDAANHMFIRHYAAKSRLVSLESIRHEYRFKSGRTLRFVNTPYSHCAGSFVTFDTKTNVLFSSDLFGSYGSSWELFLKLDANCIECNTFPTCPNQKIYCPLYDVLRFHQQIMTSAKALRHSLKQILKIPFIKILPQHGSIISQPDDFIILFKLLGNAEDVGIDAITTENSGLGHEDIQMRFADNGSGF